MMCLIHGSRACYCTVSSGTTTMTVTATSDLDPLVRYGIAETLRGFVGQIRLEGEIVWQGPPRKTREEAEFDRWEHLLSLFGYEPDYDALDED